MLDLESRIKLIITTNKDLRLMYVRLITDFAKYNQQQKIANSISKRVKKCFESISKTNYSRDEHD